jgi:hypothetical protein
MGIATAMRRHRRQQLARGFSPFRMLDNAGFSNASENRLVPLVTE